jgi:S-adenosylmethionine-diacylgycerolhomoserine-N-methlytransferase
MTRSADSIASRSESPSDATVRMDRMYRYTRHIYDLSRRYYLLGRDRLLRQMVVRPGDRVLEIGCGTGRNLVRLSRMHPEAEIYGIDASQLMLQTAERSLAQHHRKGRVALRQCLGEDVDPRGTFGLDRPFDVVFFSYTLSMIPTWQATVDRALENLREGGVMYVVDFWDQADLPLWFAGLLRKWLALFHVHHRPELLDYLNQLADSGRVVLQVEPVCRRYAYLARLERVDSQD